MVVINVAPQGWANVMISLKLSSQHCKSSVINIVSQKKMKNYSFLILKLDKNVSVWKPKASLYQTKSAEFQNVRQSLSSHWCCSGKLCLPTMIFQSVHCSHALIPFHSHDLFVLQCSPEDSSPVLIWLCLPYMQTLSRKTVGAHFIKLVICNIKV